MTKLYMVVDRIEDITYDNKVTGKKVFDKEGGSVNVKGGKKGSNLYERWDELNPDVAYEFEMDVFRKDGREYPFVVDFKAVEIALAEQEIERATKKQMDEALKPDTPSAPMQRVSGEKEGMITKEVGNLYCMGKLNQLLGEKIAATMMSWYRGQLLSTSRIPYDGKDLPPAKG